jgi:hypothetical protein
MEIKKNIVERAVHFVETKWAAVSGFYHRRAHGPLSWIVRTIAAIGRWYRDSIWMRFAENADGERTPKRMAGTIAATLLVLWMLPSAFLATWQIGLMATTWKSQEEIFLTSAEEIDPDGEVHSIRGCRVIPCGEKDAIYFRVRSSWMHDIYAFSTRGYMFYPEEVASVVAPGVNQCTVTSYGIRVRALMRGWGIYPDMLDATCTPYANSQQFQQADPAS